MICARLWNLIMAFLSLLYAAHSQGHGALRLTRSGVPSRFYTSGIVEIYYGTAWGNICRDSQFRSNEATVVCHQLGYTGVSDFGSASETTSYGIDSKSTLIEDVGCSSSNYLVLLQCSVTPRYSTNCISDSMDTYVVCYTTRLWDNPFSGQIRLTGGSYSNQGRLEVYCNEEWGTVCADSFLGTDANVACRQLGYTNSYSISSLTGSSLPVWFNYVRCSSSSMSCLTDCRSCSSYSRVCSRSRVVSLDCGFNMSRPNQPHATLDTCHSTELNVNAIGGGIAGAGLLVSFLMIIGTLIVVFCCPCCKNKKSTDDKDVDAVVVSETNGASKEQVMPLTAYPAAGYPATTTAYPAANENNSSEVDKSSHQFPAAQQPPPAYGHSPQFPVAQQPPPAYGQ